MHSIPACKTENGFTLLEVMIALAILGTVLIACLTLANRCIRSQELVRHLTTGSLLAQQKMSELEMAAQQGLLSMTDDEGVWDAPYANYRWSAHFRETPVEGVLQITVTVLWGDLKRNEEVHLDSFVFN
ncbi:MAG: prepilin-type N-terminal cleavage/methylation domain-containing protein [Desulfuromonadaceae bacterium]|nr:prepilin-type N-terminal cleavage/methylation domain-containing protein [Desulfuromonadaceae bacterium]